MYNHANICSHIMVATVAGTDLGILGGGGCLGRNSSRGWGRIDPGPRKFSFRPTDKEKNLWGVNPPNPPGSATDMQGRIQDFLQGGDQRRPCTAGAFGARADGGSRVDINIRLRYIASIEFFFLL